MKSILFIFFSGIAFSSLSQNTGSYHLDENYDINPKGTVKLTVSDAKVTIVGSQRAKVHLKIDREVITKGIVFGHEEFGVDVRETGGDLEIKERSNSVSVGMIGYQYEKYTVTLEVPEGASLTVRGDDGDYQIKNVGGAISLRLDDADVELSGCTGDNFEFAMDDGDLKMDQGKGRLEIDGDDTDVRIQHASFTEVRANLDDGDLIIETSLADQGNYFIDGQDGLISLTILQGGGKFDIRHDDGHVSLQGNFEVTRESEDQMLVSLADGNAHVNIKADDARVRLIRK